MFQMQSLRHMSWAKQSRMSIVELLRLWSLVYKYYSPLKVSLAWEAWETRLFLACRSPKLSDALDCSCKSQNAKYVRISTERSTLLGHTIRITFLYSEAKPHVVRPRPAKLLWKTGSFTHDEFMKEHEARALSGQLYSWAHRWHNTEKGLTLTLKRKLSPEAWAANVPSLCVASNIVSVYAWKCIAQRRRLHVRVHMHCAWHITYKILCITIWHNISSKQRNIYIYIYTYTHDAMRWNCASANPVLQGASTISALAVSMLEAPVHVQ